MFDDLSEFKVVALINKRLPTGQALNAIAHLGLGLCAAVGDEGRHILQFLDFVDRDGGVHRSISARSLVVLQGSSGDIRRLRRDALDTGLPCVDFTVTMTGGDYQSQIARTSVTAETELEYFGVITFGKTDILRPITRKYSLWRQKTDDTSVAPDVHGGHSSS